MTNKAQIVIVPSHRKRHEFIPGAVLDAIRRQNTQHCLILSINYLNSILPSSPNFHLSKFSALIEHIRESYLYSVLNLYVLFCL